MKRETETETHKERTKHRQPASECNYWLETRCSGGRNVGHDLGVTGRGWERLSESDIEELWPLRWVETR